MRLRFFRVRLRGWIDAVLLGVVRFLRGGAW